MADTTIQQKLDELLDCDVSAASWLTRDDHKNGNGAHSYVAEGQLELVDQGYGWEYRVVKTKEPWVDVASLAFDAAMVSCITTDDNGDPMIVVILTDD